MDRDTETGTWEFFRVETFPHHGALPYEAMAGAKPHGVILFFWMLATTELHVMLKAVDADEVMRPWPWC